MRLIQCLLGAGPTSTIYEQVARMSMDAALQAVPTILSVDVDLFAGTLRCRSVPLFGNSSFVAEQVPAVAASPH
jgi:hypothetical protein